MLVLVGVCGRFLLAEGRHQLFVRWRGYFLGVSRRPRPFGAMHVVTNRRQGARREYVTHLLRHSFREDGKVKNETLANLSHLPDGVIELIRGALAGRRYVDADGGEDGFEIERSLPAGHVQAALSMARRLELGRLLDRQPSRERDLCLAMDLPAGARAGLQARGRQGAWAVDARLRARGHEHRRGRSLRGDGLAACAPGADRGSPRAPAPARSGAGALRRLLVVFRGAHLPARAARVLPRWQARDPADHLRALVRQARSPSRPVAVEVFSGERHDDKTLPRRSTSSRRASDCGR